MLLKLTNVERIHHQLTHALRNIKGSHSGRRKMIPDGKMDRNKGIKNTADSNYTGKLYNFSVIIFKSFK